MQALVVDAAELGRLQQDSLRLESAIRVHAVSAMRSVLRSAPADAVTVGDKLDPERVAPLFEAALRTVIGALAERLARLHGLPLDALRSARFYTERSADVDEWMPRFARRSAALEKLMDSVQELRVSGLHVELPPTLIGHAYETLIRHEVARPRKRLALRASRQRRSSGSFYTPTKLATLVMQRALDLRQQMDASPPHPCEPEYARRFGLDGSSAIDRLLSLRICDPALGAGVFLVEAAEQMSQRVAEHVGERQARELRPDIARRCLYGVDKNPLAVQVAELCLWLHVGEANFAPQDVGRHLRPGDTLLGNDVLGGGARNSASLSVAASAVPAPPVPEPGFDWTAEFPEVAGRGFDIVMGNPPWVAFAGRSAQPLPPAIRNYFKARYTAWTGFPTLHGLFIARAVELAPRGVVALLVPSPVADLDGYQAVRRALRRRHEPVTPLIEFGQDAFSGVTQPCFLLLAQPRPVREVRSEPGVQSERDLPRQRDDAPWQLSERQRARAEAELVAVPEVLHMIRRAPVLPRHAFREMGFQTSRIASESLLLRASEPSETHTYPLLEGRDVNEFHQRAARLYLWDDPVRLNQAGCRTRPREQYQAVRFVVRQTASVPIAALHCGAPFRNSLLAGMGVDGFEGKLLVALLNSSLYRALHLSACRDARQAAFPQVKLSHLRALPMPPEQVALRRELAELCDVASRDGMDGTLRVRLDALVFDLFAVPHEHRALVLRFLKQRAPRFAVFDMPPEPASVGSLASVAERIGCAYEWVERAGVPG